MCAHAHVCVDLSECVCRRTVDCSIREDHIMTILQCTHVVTITSTIDQIVKYNYCETCSFQIFSGFEKHIIMCISNTNSLHNVQCKGIGVLQKVGNVDSLINLPQHTMYGYHRVGSPLSVEQGATGGRYLTV